MHGLGSWVGERSELTLRRNSRAFNNIPHVKQSAGTDSSARLFFLGLHSPKVFWGAPELIPCRAVKIGGWVQFFFYRHQHR